MWAYAGLLREDSTLRLGLAAQQACADALAELAAQNKGSRRLTEALDDAQHREFLQLVSAYAAPRLLHDGNWTADYRRLRIAAVKRDR